jgi:hypothetical protein
VTNIKIILTTAAILACLFGVGFLVAPNNVAELYGESLTPGGIVVGRYFGSQQLAIAWILWTARNGASAAVFQSVLVAIAVSQGIDILIALHAIWAGVVNALGWTSVTIHVVLSCSFAYLGFGKR